MSDYGELVKRLDEPFKVCPFDSRSPDYRTNFSGKPCPVCGGLEDGPDLCAGGDTRIIKEAARAIESLLAEKASARDEAFDECERAVIGSAFGPPSTWGGDRPASWHLARECRPEEAALHDNGCADALLAIRALRSPAKEKADA